MYTYTYHHFEYCIPKLVLYEKVSLSMYIHIYKEVALSVKGRNL